MGAGLTAVRHEYFIILIQMGINFILALLAYAIKLKNLKKQVLAGKIIIPA